MDTSARLDTSGTEATTTAEAATTTTRIRDIRARLPGQALCERVDMARAQYGPLYTLAEIRAKVGETFPFRWGQRRTALLHPLETYDQRIPDDALLKFDDASKTGLFSTFYVATPAYTKGQEPDPWLLGVVTGTDLYAVLAQWE